MTLQGSTLVEIDLAAAVAIDEAANLMNKGGKHWTVGTMCELIEEPMITGVTAYKSDPRNCSFCTVGGLRVAIFGGPTTPLSFSRPELLTKKYKLKKQIYCTALNAILHAAGRDQFHHWESAEADVADWNDSLEQEYQTKAEAWACVQRTLPRAAANLRALWTV